MKRLSLFLLLLGTPVFAADAYFVRFSGQGRSYASGASVHWNDAILLYNSGSTTAVVRPIGVSNGTLPPDAAPLILAPGQLTFLNTVTDWTPVPPPVMFVLHIDLPAGVVAESRDELSVSTGAIALPFVPKGKVSMPIFRQLISAGTVQVHLGTDLGASESRVNVAIYNAGAETATASIEVRRTCDAALVDSRALAIPTNTVVQVGGLSSGSSTGCPDPVVEPWARYTLVTVTQPSLSLVTNINENIAPTPADIGVIPIIGLGVPNNQQF